MDTADTRAINGSESDVTVLTPFGAPRVLDNPVVNTVLGTVTNSEDSVVNVDTTVLLDNTTGVINESVAASFDANGDGRNVKGGLELGNAVVGDGLVGNNGDGTVVGSASTITTSVLVLALEHDRSSLSVIEGFVLPSTVATGVLSYAVNELLFGEGEKFTSGEEVSTFHSTSGGERPAGTALTLTFDSGDGTFGSPVLGGIESVGLGQVGVVNISSVVGSEGEHLLEFS